VMALDGERRLLVTEHLHPARRVGANPDGRVVAPDMAQERSYDEASDAAQPCSSGAIVSPASCSCSQYSSAGSRCPLQTIASPVLWIRLAIA
jgi:hypothetical protein